jgi:hypothetical protein
MNHLMLIATLLIAFAFITTSGYAKRDDYTRTMKEKYEVNSNALLVVKNKFGDVHCQNWNENVISIEVTITVEASSEDKANKVFNKIDVLMKGSKDKVEAITELDGSFDNVEFSIDYDIMMPSSINLDLINKFGEIYIDEVDGTAKIGLSYGDMEVTAFNSPDVTLDIKFSDAEVDFIKAGKVDVQYSDVEINGAEKLDLKTRFSDVEIGNMGELNLDSQYDDLGIEKCGPLDCEGRFSDIELEELNGDLFLDIQYAEIYSLISSMVDLVPIILHPHL